MIPLQIKQIIALTNGQPCGIVDDTVVIDSICIDSRKITPNSLFIALVGDRFDGHAFTEQAITDGAKVVLVDHQITSHNQQSPNAATKNRIPQIIVADTRQALGQLAAYVRSQMQAKVVALTGSSGKTSVKEMTAAILQQCGQTLYTQGNFNNDIGVPLTLLRLTPADRYAVIELGANHIGEIAYTTRLVKPQTALINNIAEAHIEGFGSLAGVAQAKGEIFSGLTEDGIAIINLDSCSDAWFTQLRAAKSDREIWTFSLTNPAADFYTTDISYVAADRSDQTGGMTTFTLHAPQGKIGLAIPLVGQHNIINAIAASALALSVGAGIDDIKAGLTQLKPVKGRLFPIRLNQNQLIWDDSYNANMGSMAAAIDVLAKQPGYRVLVVGDMAELGPNSANYHQQIGELAKQLDAVVSIGQLSQLISQFSGVGHPFMDKPSAVDFLLTVLRQHETVTLLVKGSRSAKMEELIEQLQAALKVSNH